MYGVIYCNNLVAAHDDRKIISKFIDGQSNVDEFRVVKIKKKHHDDIELSDLYLVRYHDVYVPYNLYNTIKDMSEDYTSDYKFCIDILYRLLEDKKDLKEKETKSIVRVISILEREIDITDISDLKTLIEIKELDSMFKERICNENE